ncbi:SH3 domain-containing protein [Ganoderma leucocontextum]|nr:SH3 domain-containing protein [Ganoderma leucocontextum]
MSHTDNASSSTVKNMHVLISFDEAHVLAKDPGAPNSSLSEDKTALDVLFSVFLFQSQNPKRRLPLLLRHHHRPLLLQGASTGGRSASASTSLAAAAHGGQGICAVVQYSYDAQEDNEMDLIEGELIEQIEELDEGWWSGIVEVEAAAPATPPPPSPPPPPPAPPAPPPPPAVAHAEPEPEPAAEEDLGSWAIALYDYDAGEDNEISFKEGERVTQIEAVSEDWWQGTNQLGNVGLFPANYVELQG